MTSLPPPRVLYSVAASLGVGLALLWLRSSDSDPQPPAHPAAAAPTSEQTSASATSSHSAATHNHQSVMPQLSSRQSNGDEAACAPTDPAPMASAAAAAEAAAPRTTPLSADGVEVPAGAAANGVDAPASTVVSPRKQNGRAVHSGNDEAATAAAAATTAAASTAASSSPIAAAAAVDRVASPSLECGLPACFDPLLFLYQRRGLAFPRIRVLSDPAVELPAPFLHLLHHRANMTPTLSRFWCGQHVSLRVIEKVEQREGTVDAPHGVLQRWIALQVDQPTHVPVQQLSQLDSSSLLPNGPPSTPAAAARPAAAPQSTPQTNGHGHAPHSRSSSTSSTSSTCSSSSAASNPIAASAHKSSRRTHSAAKLPPKRGPKPGRLLYHESVQKIESAPSTPRVAQREQSEEDALAATPSAPIAAAAAVTAPAAAADPPVSCPPHLVEFGSIRIHLSALPESLRSSIWAGEKPFATLLLTATPKPIAQHIRPQAFFEIEWNAEIEGLTGAATTHTPLTPPPKVYGRCNHIYSDEDEKQLICEVVEILPPMPQSIDD